MPEAQQLVLAFLFFHNLGAKTDTDRRRGGRCDPEETSVPALKIGVETAGLRLPFRKALHTAAELGADAVEIDARAEVSPQELARLEQLIQERKKTR